MPRARASSKNKPRPARATVHPLNFADLSGRDFERLVFALLWRRWSWRRLDWFGQQGGDGGRDIFGTRVDEFGREELVVVACANWKRLTKLKAADDIRKLVGKGDSIPQHLIVVAGGPVSATLKNEIGTLGRAAGVENVDTWSGPEVEEMLRLYAESVIRRFYEGEAFPETAGDLAKFVGETTAGSKRESLSTLRRLFERPAFSTPIHQESSLPAFRKAISDTVDALNTGVARSRDGTPFARIASRHQFSGPTRRHLDAAYQALLDLRAAYDGGIRKKTIRPCGCGKPDCPTFFFAPQAALEIERKRDAVLVALPLAARPSTFIVPSPPPPTRSRRSSGRVSRR